MLYLAIDQHRKQLTVNLRNEQGDVLLKRQVSTEWKRVRVFLAEIQEQSRPEGGFVVILCLEPVGNGNSRSFGLELAPERGGFHECATTTLHYGPEGNHSQEVSGR
jgi:hypothetical protein